MTKEQSTTKGMNVENLNMDITLDGKKMDWKIVSGTPAFINEEWKLIMEFKLKPHD